MNRATGLQAKNAAGGGIAVMDRYEILEGEIVIGTLYTTIPNIEPYRAAPV